MKNKGQRTVPCGTPMLTIDNFEMKTILAHYYPKDLLNIFYSILNSTMEINNQLLYKQSGSWISKIACCHNCPQPP